MRDLSRMTSPEVAAAAPAVLVVPLGSAEQHGPHLPVTVDAIIATHLARELATARPEDAVLAPGLPYGSSGEHTGFAGTVSIGRDALRLLIVELCRSATDSFAGVFIVNGHGGNAEALADAVELLTAEGRRIAAWTAMYDGDAHAGHSETSMMMHLRPPLVDRSRIEIGDTTPIRELLPRLREGGVRAVSQNGVLGNPLSANAGDGYTLLTQLRERLLSDFDMWHSP